MNDAWESGQSYEPYVGRWSKFVALQFITWLDVPAEKRWLDFGCGTGALTRAILESSSPAAVRGIDRSEGYIAFARAHSRDSRVVFQVSSLESVPATETFDVVVSGLVLNFMPDPLQTVNAMKRLTPPQGVIAGYVWDYAGTMELMRHFWDTAAALDQRAIELDEGRRFPLCQPEPLRELFTSVGLRNVHTKAIDIPTRFENFDDYWTPFLGGQGPAPGYAMSLSEEKRTALREEIRSSLPVAKDGSINLTARAWAVKGTNL